MLIDAGARRAITHGKKSLLPAGIKEVLGVFSAGDVVDIADDNGLIARGISRYDSDTLARIIDSHEGSETNKHMRPAVHRDDLALLVRE